MLRLRDILSKVDRGHVERALAPSAEKSRKRVEEFLSRDTYLAEESLDAFKAMSQRDRERLLSDLLWRITCHVDDSVTKVLGVNVFGLGADFSAVQSEQDGRTIFCLVRA